MNSRQTFRYSNVVLDNDVICGRGGASNKHKGNIFFRELVTKHKENYLASSKVEKKHIAKFIVDTIRRNGGRFLKLDQPMELTDVGDISAMEKTCQALREGLKIRANKKKPKNEEKYVPVTFTESSLSSHSQYLPASHYNYSTISHDYNMVASLQNKHNATHGQINENNPRHNYNINSNRQEYLHAQDIQYSNQNQNLEINFEYNKSAQHIGKHTTYGQISANNPRHNYNYNVNSNRQAYFHAQDIQYSNQNQNLEFNFEYNKSAQHIGKHTTYGQISANNPRHNYNINSNRKGYFHAPDIQYSNQNQNLECNFEYKKPAQYIGRCTCKKSNCLKLYCQCFANSVYCSPEDCRCTNCYNSVHYSELVHQAKKKREEKCSISQRA